MPTESHGATVAIVNRNNTHAAKSVEFISLVGADFFSEAPAERKEQFILSLRLTQKGSVYTYIM